MTSNDMQAFLVAIGAIIMALLLAVKGLLQITKEIMDRLPPWMISFRAFIAWIKRGCKKKKGDKDGKP